MKEFSKLSAYIYSLKYEMINRKIIYVDLIRIVIK